jgi:hypothetical protein
MLFLAPGSSTRIKVVPKPLGISTSASRVTWDSSDSAVVSAAPAPGDASGCLAVVTAAKNARVGAAADVQWRYRNTNGEMVASSLLTVSITAPLAASEAVTGGDLVALGEPETLGEAPHPSISRVEGSGAK